jgi:hypothetical protein
MRLANRVRKTPVCQECERLTGNGVVVVAAAGNQGYAEYTTVQGGRDEGFQRQHHRSRQRRGRDHRRRNAPHTVVQLRDLTFQPGADGDGRYKPDLVAPAEKITSLVPPARARARRHEYGCPHQRRGGAHARPHGRARRYPARVKRILCSSATDLGRERYFQEPDARRCAPSNRCERPSVIFTLEALQAAHGDALLLHYGPLTRTQ